MALLKRAFVDWKDDDATRLAAAQAFYTALSIAPILIIAIAVAGSPTNPQPSWRRSVGAS